jgi:hypothetical protein
MMAMLFLLIILCAQEKMIDQIWMNKKLHLEINNRIFNLSIFQLKNFPAGKIIIFNLVIIGIEIQKMDQKGKS